MQPQLCRALNQTSHSTPATTCATICVSVGRNGPQLCKQRLSWAASLKHKCEIISAGQGCWHSWLTECWTRKERLQSIVLSAHVMKGFSDILKKMTLSSWFLVAPFHSLNLTLHIKDSHRGVEGPCACDLTAALALVTLIWELPSRRPRWRALHWTTCWWPERLRWSLHRCCEWACTAATWFCSLSACRSHHWIDDPAEARGTFGN